MKFARTLQGRGKFTVEQSASLEAKIAESKADNIKWLFGVVGFQTPVILTATVALAHVIHEIWRGRSS